MVFISYCHEDTVLARIIYHIFIKEGIDCFFAERNIHIGSYFDKEILSKIRSARLLIVLWSAYSIKSTWVQQEIGIAKGLEKPVWPIAIDDMSVNNTSLFRGFIFNTQGSYLHTAEDPCEKIRALAIEIKKKMTDDSCYSNFSPKTDQFYIGLENRTKSLLGIIQEQKRHIDNDYIIRSKSNYSSFSFSDDLSCWYNNSAEMTSLLMAEQKALSEMIKICRIKVIIWPKKYNNEYIKKRLINLIDFLEANKDFERVRFVLGFPNTMESYGRFSYNRNIFIFDHNIMLNGIKTSGTPGFDVTIVSHHTTTIKNEISAFDSAFESLWNLHKQECCSTDKNTEAEEIRGFVINYLKRIMPPGC
ncbi:MAG: toll/interleukin-1 receptor domain-containing protein [Spirochaetales bacterium]|nr:toll/interleukin-1 receptor domain-containing protein [Spirochaetales bacterium]